MKSKIFSLTLIGLDAQVIEIEVDIRRGRNMMNIIGLPDKAVTESKDRILPCIKNSECNYPKGTITVNLAPADIPKKGAMYDLPIAVGILISSDQLEINLKESILIGELSLHGEVRSITGVLTMVDAGKKLGFKRFFIPWGNREEAALVEDVDIVPIKNLNELLNHFKGKVIKYTPDRSSNNQIEKGISNDFDFKYVIGQESAKRALEIAAAGAHNCLLTGVPGSGKTYLSRCLPGILPEMTYEEKIEITRIYSISGLLEKGLIQERPFRTPHHSSSRVALVGGGAIPKPGEVTLAHRGVLFLDEFTEFERSTIETLRQPLEDGVITIGRVNRTISYPAKFMLIAAMNPCKCGYRGDPDRECTCSANEIANYNRKISGPVLDRIDLQLNVYRVKIENMRKQDAESSEAVKKRVEQAKKIQLARYKDISGVFTNSEM